jgi:hypothetical protein
VAKASVAADVPACKFLQRRRILPPATFGRRPLLRYSSTAAARALELTRWEKAVLGMSRIRFGFWGVFELRSGSLFKCGC